MMFQPKQGVVKKVKGNVKLSNSLGQTYSLKKGDILNIGDTILKKETYSNLKIKFSNGKKVKLDPRKNVIHLADIMSKAYKNELTHDISHHLYEKEPTYSAKHTFSLGEKLILGVLLFGLIVGGFFNFPTGLFWLNAILVTVTLGIWVYKFLLSTVSFSIPLKNYSEKFYVDIEDNNLPIYTILIPLYKEKEVTIRFLLQALDQLDYPRDKLDLKLILESDDIKTKEMIETINHPLRFQMLVVPDGTPRTKARACNYGLEFALGELITIFDAEDRPDPDQLKKAYYDFQQHEDKLICLQAALNFYNANENTLTRMFTLEYTFLFDLLLPALNDLNLPIPLGGTSNHFKTKMLRKLGGWDPFNVTEDADLGMRIHNWGYRVGTLYSTTYEEANCHLFNWFKQRTRWIKGYMQTYLVYMRNPLEFMKQTGLQGFMSFQFIIGGTVFANLCNILLWIVFIATYVVPHSTAFMFNDTVLNIAFYNFIAGNIILIGIHVMAAARRRLYHLIPYAFLTPFYWILMSIASYIALYELIFNPSYWYKTEHGISEYLNKSAAG